MIVDNPEFDRVLLAVLNYPGPDDSVELDDMGEHDSNREGRGSKIIPDFALEIRILSDTIWIWKTH